ncbi:MAG: hypothetical protein QG566_769 [Patescibacteria group bacterium]|jgi:hypothetical protein|nr:hypothetical protein [Patescibacteria group bacterium]
MEHSEQDPNKKFVFVRADLRDKKVRNKFANALYNLHLQRRILRETLAINYDVLNNTVYRPRR